MSNIFEVTDDEFDQIRKFYDKLFDIYHEKWISKVTNETTMDFILAPIMMLAAGILKAKGDMALLCCAKMSYTTQKLIASLQLEDRKEMVEMFSSVIRNAVADEEGRASPTIN